MTIGRPIVGGAGDVGGVVAQAVAVQTRRRARAEALAVHLAVKVLELFVGVFEVGVPVQTVFVEAQEAS